MKSPFIAHRKAKRVGVKIDPTMTPNSTEIRPIAPEVPVADGETTGELTVLPVPAELAGELEDTGDGLVMPDEAAGAALDETAGATLEAAGAEDTDGTTPAAPDVDVRAPVPVVG